MAASIFDINLTSLGVRHRMPHDTYGYADPGYGVPEQTVPLIWDPVAKAYRPFTSIGTGTANGVAAAIANFAGWANTYLEPQAQGTNCTVQVLRRGVVELILSTPAAVTTQTLLTPVLETVNAVTRVSNYTVAVTTDAALALYRVVRVCDCGSCVRKPCPPTAAAVTSGNSLLDSASTPLVYPTVRTVLAEFNVAYRSKL